MNWPTPLEKIAMLWPEGPFTSIPTGYWSMSQAGVQPTAAIVSGVPVPTGRAARLMSGRPG